MTSRNISDAESAALGGSLERRNGERGESGLTPKFLPGRLVRLSTMERVTAEGSGLGNRDTGALEC